MSTRKGARESASPRRRAVQQRLQNAGLVDAAVGAIGPDAELIRACERCHSLRATAAESWHAAYAPGIAKLIRQQHKERHAAACDEFMPLEKWIATTKARTAEGLRAKLALAFEIAANNGDSCAVPHSVIADALAFLDVRDGQAIGP